MKSLVCSCKDNCEKTSHFKTRVGRSISGFGLSPGITKEQRLEVESLMKTAFGNLEVNTRISSCSKNCCNNPMTGRPCRHLLPSHWDGRESEATACRRSLPLCVRRQEPAGLDRFSQPGVYVRIAGEWHGERLARGKRHFPQ